ncbi:MAG TPA: hypothetical protein VHC48_00360 [Puia sp.]|nr:hypothetical protein [Puia sp.]
MENYSNVQQLFFQHVRDQIPAHLSLVDEVAELLNISNDSAYRRIRGEKAISFEEIRTLCSHFRISLDQLFHLETDTILFWGKFINKTDFDFDLYLREILQLLVHVNTFDHKELLFMSKDIPIFYHFIFPELAAFKSFFWMKTILQYPFYHKKQFVSDDFLPSISQTCAKIIEEYNKLPSQEIWSVESIHATIRQIDYYKDTKTFASEQDLEKVYECLYKTIDHIEAQVERGFKFPLQAQHPAGGAPLKCYINEFVLGDNTFLFHLNDNKMVVINHAVLNTIRTKDGYFAQCTDEHFQNIISKSTQISGVGEKDRSRFFNILREKIEHSRKRRGDDLTR